MPTDPPPSPGSSGAPDEAPGSWDSLASGSAEVPARRRKLVVAAVGVGVLALLGLGAVELLSGGTDPQPRISTSTVHPAPPPAYLPRISSAPPRRRLPVATVALAGLGRDPTFDHLARECATGSMHACDELYDVSPAGSRYEAFADTCAGRQPRHTNLYCTAVFSGS